MIILVTVSGSDQPGLTSRFAGILADAGAILLDIGQAVIHNSLTFGLMVSVDSGRFDAIRDAVRAESERSHVDARAQKVSGEQYGDWVREQHRRRFVVTLLAPYISAAELAAVTGLFAEQGLNIDLMERLSGRDAASRDQEPRMCIEFSLSGNTADPAALRSALLGLADDADFNVAVQEDSIYRRTRRVVVFDMDSTLIQMEVIDELARQAGAYDQVAAVTAAAMRGEIDFPTSFRRRLTYLEGLPASALEDVASNMPITPGAHRLLRTLKSLGYKTAIVSGGFTYFAEKLQAELGFDYVYAHELEVENGRLTGRIVGDTAGIIDGPRKAQILQEIADREQIVLQQTIAVGDGANDLPMLSVAGIGIAFHAKPLVRESAKHSISLMGLDALLYLLGIRDRHVGE